MSFAGPVPTTRVNLSMDGRRSHSETWVVLDAGQTLSSNSELFARQAHCIEHTAGTQKMVVHADGTPGVQSLLPPVGSPKPRRRLDAVTNRPCGGAERGRADRMASTC
jgi:hypothetical protein